jgi:hypothetical protein
MTDVQSSPYAFPTFFSNGPRIFISRQYALYEVKTILVDVICNYAILNFEGPFKVEDPSLTLRPHGFEVRLEKNAQSGSY